MYFTLDLALLCAKKIKCRKYEDLFRSRNNTRCIKDVLMERGQGGAVLTELKNINHKYISTLIRVYFDLFDSGENYNKSYK